MDLGLIGYERAYALQKQYVDKVLEGSGPFLFLCEHPAVLTKGRMTKTENILLGQQFLDDRGIAVRDIDRGGDVTLHAPGQLVIYPIINLVDYGKDLRIYLRALEDISMAVLKRYGLNPRRESGQTGVWVDDKKVVSIGIGVKRWVSFHGVGINVNTDLSLFSCIKPCGLNVEMNSMSNILGHKLSMQEIKEKVIDQFLNIFNLVKGRSESYDSGESSKALPQRDHPESEPSSFSTKRK